MNNDLNAFLKCMAIAGIFICLTAVSYGKTTENNGILKKRGIDCSRHKIFCQIVTNNPRLKTKEALKLSNVIYNATRKHNVPPIIFTAILMQESRYQLKARGKHTGYLQKDSFPPGCEDLVKKLEERCKVPKSKYIKVVVFSDFGIGQIYVKTIERFKFDVDRLLTDLDYSVDAAARVLKGFKRKYSKREPLNWWTRYNASSPIKRDIYKKLVERYL